MFRIKASNFTAFKLGMESRMNLIFMFYVGNFKRRRKKRLLRWALSETLMNIVGEGTLFCGGQDELHQCTGV